MKETELPTSCDVLIVGAGAGGLTSAIVAAKEGLDVVVLEKEPYFGGTAALSGGVLWIPGNQHFKNVEVSDSREAALTYMRNETGEFLDHEAVEAFLKHGPEMIKFLETETEVQFVPTLYPDYHSEVGGGAAIGRSIMAAPFDARRLGENLHRLRPPLKSITFMGMMFNSSNSDLKHFFNALRSLRSAWYVSNRLARHVTEILRYGRGVNVTAGNALAARLAKSALDLDVPICTNTRVKSLVMEDGLVSGVLTEGGVTVRARCGVILASGGFSHDLKRIREAFPHVKRGGEHLSPTAPGSTGDGAALAEQAGGRVVLELRQPAAWMPVSSVVFRDGSKGVFPHLLDRYKPGIIGVLRDGRRFTNESNSYHDVGSAMIEACKRGGETAMWLICDHVTIRKYGLGYAKPAPMPLSRLIKIGYLHCGNTIAELARNSGINASELERTVAEYNASASLGFDAKFGRGTTLFNRYLADPNQLPNPCVAPIGLGPYYSLRLTMGDLGTFDGIRTNLSGQVLNRQQVPIEGLYAVGNDRASIMGGNYPAAGITLGPILTFGYLTARSIAARTRSRASGNSEPARTEVA